MDKQAKRRGSFYLCASFMLALGFLALTSSGGTADTCKAKPPIQVGFSVDPETLSLNARGQVSFFVIPEIDLEDVEVVFEWEQGDVTITGPAHYALGKVEANHAYTVTTELYPSGLGRSAVRGWAYALNKEGQRIFGRSVALKMTVMENEVLAADTSHVEIELKHALEKLNKGLLGGTDYDAAITRALYGGAHQNVQWQKSAEKGNIFVSGTIRWTSKTGSTHAARRVKVQLFDLSGATPDVPAAETTTSDSGSYSFFYPAPDGSQRNLRVRALTDSTVSNVTDPVAGETYGIQSNILMDVADDAVVSVDITANNADNNNQAFSVHDAFVTVNDYSAYVGGRLAKITVIFPRADGSFYDGQIVMHPDDWCDWDVLHHEYGHYFMDVRDIEANPGGDHIITANLAEGETKEHGLRLAWGEGFPTYFGVVAQQFLGAASLGVPNVGDSRYTDDRDVNGFSYDLESQAGGASAGEDNELAVQRILYDLYDSNIDQRDDVSLGHFTVYSKASGVNATILSQYWNSLINGASQQDIVRYGCIFADHRVAPEPTAPDDGVIFGPGDPPPTFRWQRNGAGPSNRLNEFTVQFWNEDFSNKIHESTPANATSYTPSAADWATILGGGDIIKWVVTGKNTSAPETGIYTSCDRAIGGAQLAFVIDDTGSMYDDLEGVKSALTLFISFLDALGADVQINLITFKDNVSSRIVSNDLPAVQAVVNTLFPSGGGDCPEASVQALNLAAKNLRRGGIAMLATDASGHSGLNIANTIAALRAKGIQVNVLLSGSCEGGMKTLEQWDDNPDQKTPPDCLNGDCIEDLPEDPPGIPTEAVAAFSTIAAETNGTFVLIPEVRRGDPDEVERYVNTAYNIMRGSVMPAIVSVEPPSGYPGSTFNVEVVASETSFNATTQLTFSGTGITVNSGAPIAPNRYRASITIAGDADAEFHDVTVVTNLGGGAMEEATGEGAFRVLLPTLIPVITSVEPKQAGMGETVQVAINTMNFEMDLLDQATFQMGRSPFTVLEVLSAVPTGPDSCVVEVLIPNDPAALGVYNVSLSSTNFSTVSKSYPGPFVVTGTALSAGLVPRILQAQPPAGEPGTSLTVLLSGENTNFADGESAVIFSGTGIVVNEVRVLNETSLEADIDIEAAAPLGIRSVTVTTGSEVAAGLSLFLVGNALPVANAGPDQLVHAVGETAEVTLDGSASFDPDGVIVEYQWSGEPAPGDVVMPVLTLTPGVYTFTLVVVDDNGASSAPDQVVIIVNDPPVADAGPDQTVELSNGTAEVTLDGSASTDSDGEIVTYTWTGEPDPDDEVNPVLNLSSGVYTFTLTVTDDRGAVSAPDTVTVTVGELPELEVTPSGTVDMGQVAIAESAEQTITVRNAGGSRLTGEVELTGDTAFGLAKDSHLFDLGEGESKVFTVQFSPTETGAKSAELAVNSNAGNAIVTLNAEGIDPPVLFVSPDPSNPLSFGIVDTLRSKSLNVTVRNDGASPLTGTVQVMGSETFSLLTADPSFNLAPGESKTFTIRFAPTTRGSFTSNMHILSNAGNVNVVLNGTSRYYKLIRILGCGPGPETGGYGGDLLVAGVLLALLLLSSRRAIRT